MSTAAKEAARKAREPHRYCSAPRCLWLVVKRDGTLSPCRKHPQYATKMMQLAHSLSESPIPTPAEDDHEARERRAREDEGSRYFGRETPEQDRGILDF